MDDIGKLYHTLTVLQNTPTDLGAGGKDNYTTLLTTRASLRPSGGSRANSFSEITGNSSWVIVTRYQDALWNAMNMAMKFQIDGDRYTMQSWERVKDDRKSYIRFSVTSERNG